MNVQNGGQAELRPCPQAEPPPGLPLFPLESGLAPKHRGLQSVFLHDGAGCRSLKPSAATPSFAHGHRAGSQQSAGLHSVDGVTREKGAALDGGRGSLGS